LILSPPEQEKEEDKAEEEEEESICITGKKYYQSESRRKQEEHDGDRRREAERGRRREKKSGKLKLEGAWLGLEKGEGSRDQSEFESNSVPFERFSRRSLSHEMNRVCGDFGWDGMAHIRTT